MTDFRCAPRVHRACTARAPMWHTLCATMWTALALFAFTPAAQALPAEDAIIVVLEDVCLPIAEGDEPDLSVLSRHSEGGGAAGDVRVTWTDKSCRVIVPIDGADESEQEDLVKAITRWAKGPVPAAEVRGRWSGDRPMYSVANIESGLEHLALIAYLGTETQIYFEFIWPQNDDDEDEDN